MFVEIPLHLVIRPLGMQHEIEPLCHAALLLCAGTGPRKGWSDFMGRLDTPMVEDDPEATTIAHWMVGQFMSPCGAARGRACYWIFHYDR